MATPDQAALRADARFVAQPAKQHVGLPDHLAGGVEFDLTIVGDLAVGPVHVVAIRQSRVLAAKSIVQCAIRDVTPSSSCGALLGRAGVADLFVAAAGL